MKIKQEERLLNEGLQVKSSKKTFEEAIKNRFGETIQEKESNIVASSSSPSPHPAINNNTSIDPPSINNNI